MLPVRAISAGRGEVRVMVVVRRSSKREVCGIFVSRIVGMGDGVGVL